VVFQEIIIFLVKMTKIFLFGSTLPELTGSRLPTQGELLRHTLYFTQILSLGISEALDASLKNASIFWEKAGLEIKTRHYCKAHLKSFYDRWKGLQKTNAKNREKPVFQKNVNVFLNEMQEGFDMAGKVLQAKLERKDPEAKKYLDDQLQGERKYRLEGKDKKATKKAQKDLDNQKYNRKRNQSLINKQEKWNEEKQNQEQEQVKK
jgi:hypothetical protein